MKYTQISIRQYSKRVFKELAYQIQSLPRAASVPSLPPHCAGSSPSYKEGLTASQQQRNSVTSKGREKL